MVTKLKNSRKFAVVFMIAVILLSAVVMVSSYTMFSSEQLDRINKEVQEEGLVGLSEELTDGVYFLYNQVYEKLNQSELINYFEMDDFLLLRKYMDYEIVDFDGKILLEDEKSRKVKQQISESTDYAFRVVFVVDGDGMLQDVQVDGSTLDEQAAYRLEQNIFDRYDGAYNELEYSYELVPAGVKVVFAMSEEQLSEYIDVASGIGYEYAVTLSNEPSYLMYEWILVFFTGVMALLIAMNKAWRVHDWKIFRAPFELVLFVWFLLVAYEQSYAWQAWNVIDSRPGYMLSASTRFASNFAYLMKVLMNVGMWMAVFGAVLWGVICLQEIFVLKKNYWKERTVCVKIYRWRKKGNDQYGDKVKQGARDAVGFFRRVWKKLKNYLQKVYHEFLHMDLQKGSDKMIIKALVINFILLLIITCFWFYGILALILYSVIMFYVLRKYLRDIRKKYEMLLESTNLLAEGNLDAPIEGDFGIFNPMKTEVQKIQKGFKKAVQEEVKSERMKTELITNVSHDLKTPLTAIITYVDLLKSEENPEKCKEYLEILEKKSLRLKVLIEDLFEISKATSKNVTMNFMEVDIVGLLKQVGVECDEKIKTSNLEFRWKVPEGKIVMLLDSQKTYRIFENLIVNITKYAMPHTRVYIDLTEEENFVSVSMKNVSAAELNFNSEEITDRFVRGDASRNTEGSGLGLAIAKSFTELQFGTLKVSTDADLFKVVIRFPKRTEAEELQIEEQMGN